MLGKLFIGLSIIPVSILSMIYGWGLSPENWWWIAGGYVWLFLAPMAVSSD